MQEFDTLKINQIIDLGRLFREVDAYRNGIRRFRASCCLLARGVFRRTEEEMKENDRTIRRTGPTGRSRLLGHFGRECYGKAAASVARSAWKFSPTGVKN